MAAGQAVRFGSDKRFARLASGELLWRASLNVYVSAGVSGHIIVGKGESDQFIQLPAGYNLHECAEAHKGMSASLNCGLQQVGAEFALVALADMPFLRSSTISSLLSAAGTSSGIKAIQPYYKQTAGHPKLLHRNLFADIAALRGDQGGSSVLRTLAARELLSLDVDDAGVLRDVDVPADMGSATH